MQNKHLTLENNNFLKGFKTGIKGEDQIDDLTFDQWKSELQKDLPSFWESLENNL